jgi:hypothetical protein
LGLTDSNQLMKSMAISEHLRARSGAVGILRSYGFSLKFVENGRFPVRLKLDRSRKEVRTFRR